MQESMLARTRHAAAAMIDLNADDYPLGVVASITDRTGRAWTQNDNNKRPYIVADPTMGKVFEMQPIRLLSTPIAKIDFTGNFELELVLKPGNTTVGAVFSTGDYGNNGRIPGLMMYVNQFSGSYLQAFLDSGGDYLRLMPSLTNTLVWERWVIRHLKGTGFTAYIYRNNVLVATTSVPDIVVPNSGSYANLGTSVIGSAGFTGYIKSLRLTYI